MPATEGNNEELSDDLAALQLVSLSVDHGKDKRLTTTVLSLFDTGSPVSFAKKSVIPFLELAVQEETKYVGVGGRRINSFGKYSVEISFRNLSRRLTVIIVSDDIIPTPLILGRDFLKLFGIGLIMRVQIPIKGIEFPDILPKTVDCESINFVYRSMCGVSPILVSPADIFPEADPLVHEPL